MAFSRRAFLGGAGAALATAVRPASGLAQRYAEPRLRLVGGRMRTSPRLPELSDVARLISEKHCISGLRPHRTGGVNLDTEKYEVAGGTKFIVHNYGHSGAGVTLSWGCAAEVVKSVRTVVANLPGGAVPNIAVIGAGVIGLTSAHELRRAFPDAPMRVYTKDFDKDEVDLTKCCSWVAGGQIEPSVIIDEYTGARRADLNRFVATTVRRINEFQSAGRWDDYGIAARLNYTGMTMMNTGFERVMPTPNFWKPEYGALPFANMNNSARQIRGALYKTWLMNPRIMMPALVQELKTRRVPFHQRTFRTRFDVLSLPENIIVNCSGLGAAEIFTDPAMRAIKGQLMILPNNQKLDYFFSGGCGPRRSAYVFFRQNDVVLGGSYEDRVETEGCDEAHCKEFLARLRLLFIDDPTKCGVYVEGYRADS